jgi:hypothetical protein
MLFRLLSVANARTGVELQTYDLSGNTRESVPFRVLETDTFADLAPHPSRKLARHTYLVPESEQYLAFDAVLTHPASDALTISTHLLSLKVTASATDMYGDTFKCVYGNPEEFSYDKLRMPTSKKRKHADSKATASGGQTLREAKTNLATLFHFVSTREEKQIRVTDLGKFNEISANVPVKYLVVSPRTIKDIKWLTDVNPHPLIRVVPLDSLYEARIVPRECGKQFSWH